MRRTHPLTIAHPPCSASAFCYDALEHGLVSVPGYRLRFHCEPLPALNRDAVTGTHAVTAISSAAYPAVAARYAILGAGTVVGRDAGPVLVSREPRTLSALAGRRVGVPGVLTTGWFLLRTLCPGAVPVEVPFDAIAAAVAAGALDAGVLIHEELLDYPRLGLRKVIDLGAEWCWRNALPLPVGLNVVRRDLGAGGMRAVCHAVSASLLHARMNPDAALDRVSRFGRGCTERFVQMFATDDAQRLTADVRAALRVLFTQVVALGAGPAVPPIEIVDPATASVVVA
ncbi:MqnA/MqnD/SBP family protein [Frigoriglobus tundricola]|uniref:Menaquinone biosynthetic enzyme MqnD n=1 Tax=Frigoriglobus tundricola TaxID=2774151 RepID=A0A6M5YXB4_9BACT|nr:MqnA/MqnD/SBP family protein [Frigoriglobus tundricola]QJW98757.1 hypothetical protein FTUN_6352 [Frigoriglobus tundricola]